MEVSLKTGAIVLVTVIAASFCVGRYSTPSKVVTKTQTVTNSTEDKVTNVADNKDETIEKTIEKDGTIKEEIHITDKSNSVTTDQKNSTTTTQSTTTTTNINSDWNISALATPSRLDDTLINTGSMAYGVHIQRKIIGPFSVGVFGLSNKVYGLSIGGSF
jgi:lipopolysaccharide export LptBFGC system permease protein LptF